MHSPAITNILDIFKFYSHTAVLCANFPNDSAMERGIMHQPWDRLNIETPSYQYRNSFPL